MKRRRNGSEKATAGNGNGEEKNKGFARWPPLGGQTAVNGEVVYKCTNHVKNNVDFGLDHSKIVESLKISFISKVVF